MFCSLRNVFFYFLIRSYQFYDAQGSVRSLTNSSGTPTDEYDYTAFGELSNHTGSSDNPYLYTGQQFDDEIDLYSLRARYYDPANGRFLSKDEAAIVHNNPIELNRYGYTANNPIKYADPSGYGIYETLKSQVVAGISILQGKATQMVNSVIFQALINIVLSGAMGAVAYFLALVVKNVPQGRQWDEGRNDNSLLNAIIFGLIIGGVNFAINQVFNGKLAELRHRKGFRSSRRGSEILGSLMKRFVALGFAGMVAAFLDSLTIRFLQEMGADIEKLDTLSYLPVIITNFFAAKEYPFFFDVDTNRGSRLPAWVVAGIVVFMKVSVSLL